MTCPNCRFEQPDSPECARCGIVFAKWRARHEKPPAPTRTPEPPAKPASIGLKKQPAPPVPREAGVLRPSPGALRDACTGLALLLRAGIGIVEALRTLSASSSKALHAPLNRVAILVAEGATVSEAMQRFPALFSLADVGVMRAAERVGELARGFDIIADGHRERLELRTQLLRSAIYPLIVVVVHIFLAPITILLESPKAYMVVVSRHLAILVGAILLCVFGVPALARVPRVNGTLKRAAWRLPWPATVYVAHARTLFVRTLGRGLAAGLALFESLRGASAVTNDPEVEARAQVISDAVVDGQELAPQLTRSGLVARPDATILVAGEQSGRLAETLETLGRRYAEQRARALRNLATVIGTGLTVAVLVAVALSTIGAYKKVMSGPEELMKEIEKSSPLKDLPQGGELPSIPSGLDSLGKESPFRELR